MSFIIDKIITYPVKGLAGITHNKVKVTKNQLLPGDRAYAITAGTAASYESASDQWLKKAHFLQMMADDVLARFTLAYDAAKAQLALTLDHKTIFEGCLNDQHDAARLCDVIASYVAWPDDKAPPRLFHRNDGGLTDTKTPFISFGNQASIGDFATREGLANDDRRFRLNIMMTGGIASEGKPLEERALIGKKAKIGSAVFAFEEAVGRCAAIELDPDSAKRTKGLVQRLEAHYGTNDMGIFAMAITDGAFQIGDQVEIIED